MFLLIKIIASLSTFLYRFITKNSLKLNNYKSGTKLDGVEVYTDTDVSKLGVISATYFIIEADFPVLFKLSFESKMNLFFKKLGLANEAQTGDAHFDKKVYVASDNFSFQDLLVSNSELRDIILSLFESGCEYVLGDGKVLHVKIPGDKKNDPFFIESLVKMFKCLKNLKHEDIKDPFRKKILIVESLVWMIFAYSGISFFAWLSNGIDTYLKFRNVITAGICLSAFLLIVSLICMAKLLRGSSRTHRVFVENAFYLVLSIPMAGINLLNDINVQFDYSRPELIEVKVLATYIKHRKSRFSSTPIYYVDLEPLTDRSYKIPKSLRIQEYDFQYLHHGETAVVAIKNGSLGFNWIEYVRSK